MSAIRDDVFDRCKGALFGLIVGDALGVPLAGLMRDSRPKVVNMVGGGIYDLAPGQWTGSTSQALALASALIENGKFDPNSIMKEFVAWYQHGKFSSLMEAFDVNPSLRESLNSFIETRMYFPNITSTDAITIARLAPVVIAYRDRPADAAMYAKRQSDLTHGNVIPGEICARLALGMREAIMGQGKDRTLAMFDMFAAKIGRWRGIERGRIKSWSQSVDAIKAALWSVDNSNSFEEAVVLAVNLAVDSSIIGAITGQLAGSIYGFNAIPMRWRVALQEPELLSDTMHGLWEFNS